MKRPASSQLDLPSFAEVDSAGKFERLGCPFSKKKTFAEKAPLGLAIARVNFRDPRISNLEGHAFDRNFNVHGEMYATHGFLVYPDIYAGFVTSTDQ